MSIVLIYVMYIICNDNFTLILNLNFGHPIIFNVFLPPSSSSRLVITCTAIYKYLCRHCTFFKHVLLILVVR